MKDLTAAAVASAAILAAGAVHAAVLSQTQFWYFAGLGSSYEEPQPTFDPTLGKLDGVRVVVSGQMDWNEQVMITQPPGHVTVFPEDNSFGASWYDNLGNFEDVYGFSVAQQYFVDRQPYASNPGDTVKIYGTFTQNPALFADGAME